LILLSSLGSIDCSTIRDEDPLWAKKPDLGLCTPNEGRFRAPDPVFGLNRILIPVYDTEDSLTQANALVAVAQELHRRYSLGLTAYASLLGT